VKLAPLLVLAACTGPAPEGEGIVGDALLNPFPSMLAVDGGHLAIPADALPVPIDGTPVPFDRLGFRTGFSRAQVSWVVLPDVDADALPSWREPTPGEGGVLLVDLDDGEFLPVMAELDAHPDAVDAPSLLIRPMVAMTPGHRVAVVVTRDVADRPERFDALIGPRPPEDLDAYAEGFRALVDDLDALGVPEGDIALAWDFPIDDQGGRGPLVSALEQATPPNTWALPRVRDKDAGELVAPTTWRAADGTFDSPSFLLADDGWLDLGADGALTQHGTLPSYLYVHVPEKVKDAPAGSVPVLVFGHGIFGSPEYYLDDEEDRDGVLALADEAGVIVVATRWRGMYAGARVDALGAAQDFGQLPIVTDRLLQGVVDTRTLVEMVRSGPFLDDPVFQGASGQKLPDPTKVGYYGISLGGIGGAVLVGSGAPLDAAVLHVGGSSWSTMLERSTQWVAFELFLEISVPDPADRQLLYAGMQLFWDPVDPIAWSDELAEGPPVLWQESIGDEQVPNMTTEAVARSAGAVLLGPAVREPYGMTATTGPLPAGSIAVAQFDPLVGEPDDVNRPGENSGAHSIPRTWVGARLQAVDFLDPAALGTVTHHCGATACTANHTGP